MSLRTQIVLSAAAVLTVALLAGWLFYAILTHTPQPIEVRLTAPRVLGLPPAPNCDPLYNVGRHVEWSKCMGVPYKKGGL